MPTKLKATASVQVTLVVQVNEVWGLGCQIEQVHKQARQKVIDVFAAMNADKTLPIAIQMREDMPVSVTIREERP